MPMPAGEAAAKDVVSKVKAARAEVAREMKGRLEALYKTVDELHASRDAILRELVSRALLDWMGAGM